LISGAINGVLLRELRFLFDYNFETIAAAGLSIEFMSDEQDFKKRADAALSHLSRELAGAGDDYGFRSGYSAGTITVDCGPGGKLTISANPAAQQIWLALPAKSYKLDWDIVEAAFVHSDSGQTLRELVEQALSRQLRQDVTL